MNKRIKKKKDIAKQWSEMRIITLSSPRWKRRKARMKMGRRVKLALIGGPNRNRRTYPMTTLSEAIQRFEATIKLTPADNPDKILFEGEVKHPCDSSYLNGTFGYQKTTP